MMEWMVQKKSTGGKQRVHKHEAEEADRRADDNECQEEPAVYLSRVMALYAC
jgi:hypothetical protein